MTGISQKRVLAILLLALLLISCASAPITGRSQFLLISEEESIKASEPAYFEMLKEPAQQGKIDNDPSLKARVETITGRIIAQAIALRPETTDWKWSIHIIDDPETVNAWAMAGGRMALYTGLVEKIEPSDDELAQVMGHEIAHALAKHTAEKMSVALASDLAVTAVAASQDNSDLALVGATLAAALAIKLPNSRTAESEADRIGIELAARAGYDPRAAVTLWQKMKKASGGKAPLELLSTHPAPQTRIKDLQALVPKMMPYYQKQGSRPVYHFKPEAERLGG
ncbi:MAG TPA: M48 family peptidase [Gammaproteobacteria bacterium]|nr:M48 family peptidase [Gammaproteobacteria bacterium]